jgi:hypothetical protein
MPLLDVFWSMLWFFLFIAWIWVLISVIADIFRSRDMGGGAKAFWVIFVIVIPWLGVLVYLIARGQGMAERSMQMAAQQEKATRAYIQEAAGSSSADELKKLADLKAAGVINDAEFAAQKAKLLG